MTQVADIKWASYREYEGPFFVGTEDYFLPPNPTKSDRFMAVVTATEGGHYNAINMYDRCIISVGLIQWCEAGMCGLSNMLSTLLPTHRGLLDNLIAVLAPQGVVDFAFTPGGAGRFKLDDGRYAIAQIIQTKIWLGGASGLKGQWTPEAREYAKGVAAVVANLFAKEVVKSHQVEFTASRLTRFVLPEAGKLLFNGSNIPPVEFQELLQAAYISFAANNPVLAQLSLLEAFKAFPGSWSREFVCHILKCLTFNPKIVIYPARYNAIRPVLERLYGVDLPDFATELQDFHANFPIHPDAPKFETTGEIQTELIACGFDLGPKGADGKMGAKTILAIRAFQKKHELSPDGVVGPATHAALIQSYRSRTGS